MKRKIIYIWLLLLWIIFIIIAVNFYVLNFSKTNYFYDVDWLDNKYVWLVFWASVKSNWEPSDILKDRLKVAYDAYKKWKIQRIIVSWDNSAHHYNEPISMKKYLLKLWVEETVIYLDYAWFDTYDSLYRAKEIFWVDEIVLFTQDFHLKRAMYIASKLWIKSYWVETNLQKYIADDYNKRREIFARIKAFLEVEILKVEPTYLWETIKILNDEEIEEAKQKIINNK